MQISGCMVLAPGHFGETGQLMYRIWTTGHLKIRMQGILVWLPDRLPITSRFQHGGLKIQAI